MTAVFALATCIGLDAPWYAYVIGLMCLYIDGSFP